MIHHLFKRKPLSLIHEEMKGENRLRRVLGPWSLTSLGIGCVIGAGIFVITGEAAHNKAGPALMLSFVVAGMACIFSALCYAEFASMAPVAGSAYTYAYVTLGEMFAWIIGWDLVLEYTVASATVAHGWSKYFQNFLEMHDIFIPKALSNAPFLLDASGQFTATGTWFDLPALVVVAILTAVLVVGIRESARFNNTMVAIKVVGRTTGHHRRCVLCQNRQLATVCSVRLGRPVPLWQIVLGTNRGRRHALGHAGGGRDHLLCVYRLRLGLDARRGGPQSAAGCPLRHCDLTDHLHDTVHPGDRRAHRHGSLPGDRCGCSHRDGVPAGGIALGAVPGIAGRGRRPHVRHAGADAQPAACVAGDGAGWPAAGELLRRYPPPLPHPLEIHDPHRRRWWRPWVRLSRWAFCRNSSTSVHFWPSSSSAWRCSSCGTSTPRRSVPSGVRGCPSFRFLVWCSAWS